MFSYRVVRRVSNPYSGWPGDSLGGANRDKLPAFNFASLWGELLLPGFWFNFHSPTESVI